MTIEKLKEIYLQGEEREAARIFRELLHGSVRAGLYAALEEEVELLCGRSYAPDVESDYRRAGSERGVAYMAGGKESIRRPRVRRKGGGEVKLAVYEAASSPQGLFEQVVAAVGEGLGIRGSERALKGAVGKSTVGRMWEAKSREQLALVRSRELGMKDWLGVLLDGVWLSKELCVLVAVGIDMEGNKQVLDFEEGTSESVTTVESLLRRLERRGVREKPERCLLVLRDGSAAISKGVRQVWPGALQQECLVHAQSALRDKLRKRDRADLDNHFARLRDAQGKVAGEEAFGEMVDFVSERNAAAGLVLLERRERLLAFHGLDVPSTLNTTFLSTNLIENVFRNWREATGNIKRWNEKGDMVSRWMASGLLWAEAGFRKVRGHGDLPLLAAALAVRAQSSLGAVAPSSSIARTASAATLSPCRSKTNHHNPIN